MRTVYRWRAAAALLAVAMLGPVAGSPAVADDRLAAVDLALPDDEYDPDLRERREALLAEQEGAQERYTELTSELAETEARLEAAAEALADAEMRLADARELLDELTEASREATEAADAASEAADAAARVERRTLRQLRQVERELDRETEVLTDRVLVWHKRGPVAASNQLTLIQAALGADTIAEVAWADHTLNGQIEDAGSVVARVSQLRDERAAVHAEAASAAADARRTETIARRTERDAQAAREAQAEQVATVVELRDVRAERAAAVADERDELRGTLAALDDELGTLARQLEAVAREQGRRPVWPAEGRVSSPFGYRMHPIHNERRLHAGLDIAAPTGTPIVAVWTGRVVSAGSRGGYGLTVVLDHGDGRMTLYAHMSRIDVSVGQVVRRGERLGAVGSTGASTGPHLHLEVRDHGAPRDPRPLLP